MDKVEIWGWLFHRYEGECVRTLFYEKGSYLEELGIDGKKILNLI